MKKDADNSEAFISEISECITLKELKYKQIRDCRTDRNILPSKKAAEQHLAFMQLHQLRDCYRQGWVPSEYKVSFGIIRRIDGCLNIDRFMYSSRFLSFPNKEIAEEFLNNFYDLIEKAEDLI